MKAICAMNFSFSAIVAQKFGYSFLLNSRYSSISSFISFLIQVFLNRELFSFHELYISFLLFLLLLKSSFNLWWSDGMQGAIQFMVNVSFEDFSMRCWEESVSVCVWVKCSVDIYQVHLSHNIPWLHEDRYFKEIPHQLKEYSRRLFIQGQTHRLQSSAQTENSNQILQLEKRPDACFTSAYIV